MVVTARIDRFDQLHDLKRAEPFVLLNMRCPMAQSISRPYTGLAERRIAPAPLYYLDRDIGRFARDLLAGGWMSALEEFRANSSGRP